MGPLNRQQLKRPCEIREARINSRQVNVETHRSERSVFTTLKLALRPYMVRDIDSKVDPRRLPEADWPRRLT